MRRREFISLLGGAAAGGRLRARAATRARAAHRHSPGGGTEDDPEFRLATRHSWRALQQLGWIDGRNVRIEYRWAGGDAGNMRKHAAELAALAPDVILAGGSAPLAPLQQATRTVPIVFAIRPRSGRRRLRRKSGAARRQHHGVYAC